MTRYPRITWIIQHDVFGGTIMVSQWVRVYLRKHPDKDLWKIISWDESELSEFLTLFYVQTKVRKMVTLGQIGHNWRYKRVKLD